MPDSLHPVSQASDSVHSGSQPPESVVPDSDFELGRSALLEITSAESIGAPAGSVDEGGGVTTVYFETLLAGYPGWRWTASIAHVPDTAASVLETELTPGETALLSPAWVPWVDRLADYTAAQDAAVDDDAVEDDDDDDDDDGDDDDDDDDNDNEDDDSDVLHSGDLDGVDIDESDDDDDPDDDDPDDDDPDDDDPDDDDTDDDGEPEDEHERSV